MQTRRVCMNGENINALRFGLTWYFHGRHRWYQTKTVQVDRFTREYGRLKKTAWHLESDEHDEHQSLRENVKEHDTKMGGASPKTAQNISSEVLALLSGKFKIWRCPWKKTCPLYCFSEVFFRDYLGTISSCYTDGRDLLQPCHTLSKSRCVPSFAPQVLMPPVEKPSPTPFLVNAWEIQPFTMDALYISNPLIADNRRPSKNTLQPVRLTPWRIGFWRHGGHSWTWGTSRHQNRWPKWWTSALRRGWNKSSKMPTIAFNSLPKQKMLAQSPPTWLQHLLRLEVFPLPSASTAWLKSGVPLKSLKTKANKQAREKPKGKMGSVEAYYPWLLFGQRLPG